MWVDIHRRCQGFTLIKLLVVIALVAVLAGLLLAALSKAKECARSTFRRNHLRQLSLGIRMYAEDNEERLPWPTMWGNAGPTWVWQGEGISDFPSEYSHRSVRHAEAGSVFSYVTGRPRLLPRLVRNGKGSRATWEVDYLTNAFPVYRCPSTGDWGNAVKVTYRISMQVAPSGQPYERRGTRTTEVELPSETVLLLDGGPGARQVPHRLTRFLDGHLVIHNQISNFAFVDGHVDGRR